jgi:hypothetical protein
LSIIYNCARNCPLPNYYCSRNIPWAYILSAWEGSSNDGLRITCKLLASAVSEFLDEEHLHFMDMSENDILALLTAIALAGSSPDSTSQAFGYSYSTTELLKILQYFSCSAANFCKIATPSLLATVTSIILTGQLKEKIASLQLLWSLLESPELVVALKSSHKDLLERLEKKFVASVNEDVVFWGEGILAAVVTGTSDPSLEAVMEGKYFG